MAADVDAGYSIFRSKGDAASAAAAAADFEVQTSGPAAITQFHQVVFEMQSFISISKLYLILKTYLKTI